MYHTIYQRVGQPVWATDREVLRALREMFTAEALTFRAREPRKAMYQGVLAAHHAAQDLCREFRI